MTPPQAKIDRQTTPPFLLRVFFREGSHPLISELSQTPAHSAPTATVYAWKSTTLLELSHFLIPHLHSILPDPSIGTRLSYRLIYADTRKPQSNRGGDRDHGRYNNTAARYLIRELGSVVLGGEIDVSDAETEEPVSRPTAARNLTKDDSVMLSDGRFIIGDFVTVAVLPPLSDGSIAPPMRDLPASNGSLHTNAGMNGGGRGRRDWDREPARDFGSRGGRGEWGRGNSDRSAGGGFGFGRGRGGGGNGASFPSGEWRRGEQPPGGSEGSGGRGGFRGRDRW